ncbi:MAG: WG repeat-containing protein [Crocinitomicaceae bacterium]|nr:WG repeat-containing protein [Crocinitomicaceae bacterium]
MRFLFYILSIVFTISNVLSQNNPRIIKVENKFGLVDEYGNVVLPTVYDTMYSSIPDFETHEVKRISPVFIYKKNKKYGFAYRVGLDTLYSFKLLSKDESYWKVESTVYDSILKINFGIDYYSDTTSGFSRRPYYIFKYKLNNKWGLLYIRGVGTYLKNSHSSVPSIPGFLGQLEKTKPIFDEIEKMIGYSIYKVKLNGKWTFLQVLYKPANYGADKKWNKDHTAFEWELAPLIWVDRTFKDSFDTIVPLGNRYDERKYFNVKKGDKWGTVKIDDEGALNYILPCIYDSIAKEYTPLIAYTDTSTVLADYDGNGKTIEIQLVKDKDYIEYSGSSKFNQYYIYSFLSYHKFLKCKNTGTGEMSYGSAYTIIVVDSLKNQVINSFLSTEDVLYNYYLGWENQLGSHNNKILGILIGKKVKTGNSFVEYFTDVESNELKFSIDLSKEGNNDCHTYREWKYPDKLLPIINYHKIKNGERKKKYIGYYDFQTQTYKKGKCKECD